MTSQRVNIQYSIEIDELPAETTRLLKRTVDSFQSIANELVVPDNILTLETHQTLDAVRHQLAKLDASISEINELIGAYLAFKTQQLMQDPATSAPVAPDSLPGADMMGESANMLKDLHSVKARIDQFKESLDHAENTGEVADPGQ